MTKLDLRQPTSLVLPQSASPTSETAQRLIVLVPQFDMDIAPAIQNIWELANSMGASVQFIGLYADATDEPSLRRDLVIMSAMMKDYKVSTEVEVLLGKNWVDVVKSRWQAGDVVVCFDEQRVGLLNQPLSQVLQTNLDIPVYIIYGPEPRKISHRGWLYQLALWGGCIAIIVGFFLLQVRIDQFIKDSAHTIVFAFSVGIEMLLIWIWNNLFG
jgi:hypothetical protein